MTPIKSPGPRGSAYPSTQSCPASLPWTGLSPLTHMQHHQGRGGLSVGDPTEGGGTGRPGTKGQSGTQKQVPEGHRSQGLLPVVTPKDSGSLVLDPGSYQYLRVELHLQLDPRCVSGIPAPSPCPQSDVNLGKSPWVLGSSKSPGTGSHLPTPPATFTSPSPAIMVPSYLQSAPSLSYPSYWKWSKPYPHLLRCWKAKGSSWQDSS